jgi:hypothetical protein
VKDETKLIRLIRLILQLDITRLYARFYVKTSARKMRRIICLIRNHVEAKVNLDFVNLTVMTVISNLERGDDLHC